MHPGPFPSSLMPISTPCDLGRIGVVVVIINLISVQFAVRIQTIQLLPVAG